MDVIEKLPEGIELQTFNTIFYGRGRGIHSTTPFYGNSVEGSLLCLLSCSAGRTCSQDFYVLQVLMVTGVLFPIPKYLNRNDQQEFLLITTKTGEDGGLYRVFAACDFFSDRAVKSLSEIHLGY